MSSVHIAPSILAADFARLGEQVREATVGAVDRIHVDVMDGHFVPNISIGPLIVESLRPVTSLQLEAHLMINDPDKFIDAFVSAGVDSIEVHVEGNPGVDRTLQAIKSHGKKAGIVINPATPAESVESLVEQVDIVLVMTVNPGFGGQEFIRSTLSKISDVRRMIDRSNPSCELEVDGGIDALTAREAVDAVANVIVAGSAIFRAQDGICAAIDRITDGLA